MAFDVFRKKCGATIFASAIFHITRGIVPRDLSDFGLGVSKRRRYARNFRRRQTNRPLNLRYSKKRVLTRLRKSRNSNPTNHTDIEYRCYVP